MDGSSAGNCNNSSNRSSSYLPDESYLRKCLESQTIDYLLSKPACFNVLAVGEDGLGKVTLMETLFGVRATGLRDAKVRVAAAVQAAEPGREFPVQILVEKFCLGGSGCGVGAGGGLLLTSAGDVVHSSGGEDQQLSSTTASTNSASSGTSSRLTLRLMTSVNYSMGESQRSPWTAVTDHLAQQVTGYVNGRAARPFDFRPEDDERVHCCLFFLPPLGGRGLRPCDAKALRCLSDKVNLVPLLAKADSYTPEELAERKSAVSADLQRCGVPVLQFLAPSSAPAATTTPTLLRPVVMAAMGAPHPDSVRCLAWGSVSVEDERYSDVPALRSLIVERNMLVLRKTTKKFHSAVQKAKSGTLTLPRK